MSETRAGMGLRGRVAVVTGASGGVGRALSLALAGEGARLLLCARTARRLVAIRDEVRAAGVDAAAVAADLGRDRGVERLAAAARELGRVDLLIHALGVYSAGPVAAAPAAELDRLYRANLRAPYGATRALLPLLLESRGQVAFVSSTVRSRAGVAGYAATKRALESFAASLREEVAPQGVRVVTVFLGRTDTAMQEEVQRLEGGSYRRDELLAPEQVARAIVDALRRPRSGAPDELTLRPPQEPPTR